MDRRSLANRYLLDTHMDDEDEEHEELLLLQLEEERLANKSSKGAHGGSVMGHKIVHRDLIGGHERLYRDYFANPPKYCPRLFRRRNSIGRLGLSSLQKVTAAFRLLAYGVLADYVDEYVQIGESTAIESLKRFVVAIVEVFGDEYLRSPNNDDLTRLLAGSTAAVSFSGLRRRFLAAGHRREPRLPLLHHRMESDRPPDPPLTRNRAKKKTQKKGAASPPTLFPPPPATTAAVPACGGVDRDHPLEGSPMVVAGCQTNTTDAAFFASDPALASPPTSVSPPHAAPPAAEPPATPPPSSTSFGGGSITQQPPSCLVSPAVLSASVEPCVETPKGTTGVFGDVGPFQQLLRDVSGPLGHQQQSPMLSPSSVLASPVSNSEAATLSSPEGSLKPMSFADLLKKSANLASGKGKLKYYPPVVTELGTRRAFIPDELIQKQASERALTLAGYFIGKRPAFPFVQYHARRMWKQFGLSEVILNDQAYFFFKFNSEQGLNFVLENGPWLFNGMPIFIQQWQPGLCFDKPEPKKVPLWVNIFGLPLDVWDFEIISYIASVVGEPISVDRYTEEMCDTKAGRANFARVLVNASADYELPTEIDAIILGKLRKFRTEFLWKPKRCSFCKVFGHDLTSCSFRPRTVEELNIDKPVPSNVGEPSKAKVIDDGFIFPKRKNKLKPKIAPLKVGGQNPKVVFNTGVKINQRFVPKTAIPSIDTIDKGKAIIGDDKPPPKVVKTERMTTRVEDNTNSKVQNLNTERSPIKVSNQFTVLEEHPKWTADKKEVDCYVEKRGVGLEPVIINSWSRQKLEYFIDRWERVFGKELDGKLRGFTLPDRIDVGDDDDDDTSDDDGLSAHDFVTDTRPKKVSWSDRQVSTKMEQDTQ
ncbi:hypothetical protein OSB04_023761 [Centaurea solstitialis]|uniref:DUF4283 domain-containing protein n=1 Tax=Centaurea solstitialis TaxID=347529 RepID=A0AA38WBF1_9ASTR|nr:hypothetical protein OSB04_023761 [Centaurea solstitialis]